MRPSKRKRSRSRSPPPDSQRERRLVESVSTLENSVQKDSLAREKQKVDHKQAESLRRMKSRDLLRDAAAFATRYIELIKVSPHYKDHPKAKQLKIAVTKTTQVEKLQTVNSVFEFCYPLVEKMLQQGQVEETAIPPPVLHPGPPEEAKWKLPKVSVPECSQILIGLPWNIAGGYVHSEKCHLLQGNQRLYSLLGTMGITNCKVLDVLSLDESNRKLLYGKVSDLLVSKDPAVTTFVSDFMPLRDRTGTWLAQFYITEYTSYQMNKEQPESLKAIRLEITLLPSE